MIDRRPTCVCGNRRAAALLLRSIGADPAVAGAPLVTTFVDATGLLIYFRLAALMLNP